MSPAVLPIARACLPLEGEWWECGVFRGKSALIWRGLLAGRGRILRLFDTFAGRPDKGVQDTGTSDTTFEATSLPRVRALLPEPFIHWHPGRIPATFAGLERARIAFAYLDLDLYDSTRAALAFIVPRLVPGGKLVLDDVDHPTWPGVGAALAPYRGRLTRLAPHVAVLQ